MAVNLLRILVISLSSAMWDEEVDEDSGKHHQLKTEA
jgi:hypothetical protein